MAIKLPPDKGKRPPATIAQARERPESVQAGDYIEYGLTVEVSLGQGRKAWVKFGTTSAVRDDESTVAACDRIATFVNDGIDHRIDDLS